MALFPAARRAVDASLSEPKVWEVDIDVQRAEARRLAAEDAREEVACVEEVDEGEHLAARLAGLGVDVVAFRAVGQVHGFRRHAAVFPAAESVLALTASFLMQHA